MSSAEKELPDGWICKESRSRPNNYYYFNTKTGKTQWSLPINGKTKSNASQPRDNDTSKSSKFESNHKGRSKPTEGQSRFKLDDKSKDRKYLVIITLVIKC